MARRISFAGIGFAVCLGVAGCTGAVTGGADPPTTVATLAPSQHPVQTGPCATLFRPASPPLAYVEPCTARPVGSGWAVFDGNGNIVYSETP